MNYNKYKIISIANYKIKLKNFKALVVAIKLLVLYFIKTQSL